MIVRLYSHFRLHSLNRIVCPYIALHISEIIESVEYR